MKVTLEVNNETYEGKGKTVLDALEDVKITYPEIKTKGTVKLSHGKKKSERFMPLLQMRRVFANKTRKAGLAHQLESLLK